MAQTSLQFQVEFNDRLDKTISKHISYLSRSQIQLSIKKSGASVNGISIMDCSYRLKIGDDVCFTPDEQHSDFQGIIANAADFEVIFEDDHMLVINKPAGLTVHPGAGNQTNTLVNALVARYGHTLSDAGGAFRPGIVHRLDKDTSGLMLVAKNNLAHHNLSAQIANREVERKYTALVYGVPSGITGIVDKNIGRHKTERTKMTVMKIGGRSAITHYKVIHTYGDDAASMVECKLETGRTHQIRVHFDFKKNNIIGDKIYLGGRNFSLSGIEPAMQQAVKKFPRQALHSKSLKFLHPASNEEMFFEVDMPEDLKYLVGMLS